MGERGGAAEGEARWTVADLKSQKSMDGEEGGEYYLGMLSNCLCGGIRQLVRFIELGAQFKQCHGEPLLMGKRPASGV